MPLICWKYEIYRRCVCLFVCLLLMQILFLSRWRRGKRETVVIYLQLSVSNLLRLQKDKLLRRRVLPLAVWRSTYSSHPSHPILFDISQAYTNCQSALKSDSHISRKVVFFVIREQRPQAQVNYWTAVQKNKNKCKKANLSFSSSPNIVVILWNKFLILCSSEARKDTFTGERKALGRRSSLHWWWLSLWTAQQETLWPPPPDNQSLDSNPYSQKKLWLKNSPAAQRGRNAPEWGDARKEDKSCAWSHMDVGVVILPFEVV